MLHHSLLFIFTSSRTLIIRESFRSAWSLCCGSQEQEVLDNICCLCQIRLHGGSVDVCLHRHRGAFQVRVPETVSAPTWGFELLRMDFEMKLRWFEPCSCKRPTARERVWDDALIPLSWTVKNRHSLLVSIIVWVTFEQIQGLYVKNLNAGRLSSALLWMKSLLGPLYSHFCKITNIPVHYNLL